MKTIVLTHEVKSFPEWKKVYDADEDNRTRSGLQINGLYQSTDNPNLVTLIGEAPSVEALKSFMSNPALRAGMERGGVIGMPEVKILDKI